MIYFFVPKSFLPQGRRWPHPGEEYWSWRCSQLRGVKFSGICNWTVQTYCRLRDSGFPCRFTDEMPSEGIIVAHRDAFALDFMPGPKRFIVCIKPDRAPLPFAQLHVVQNARDPLMRFKGWGGRFIPHWPQPGLIPRPVSRGDAFTDVAYIGNRINIAPEFTTAAWRRELSRMGLRWRLVTRCEAWNDYSSIDAVVALRDPRESRDETNPVHAELRKPPSKLYNAWLAGVPAVLGRETAYRAERRGPHDYIEATDRAGVLRALQRLRDDYRLREAMARNGRRRAARLKEQLLGRWRDLLSSVALPAYEEWRSSPRARKSFAVTRLRYLADPSRYGDTGLVLGAPETL